MAEHLLQAEEPVQSELPDGTKRGTCRHWTYRGHSIMQHVRPPDSYAPPRYAVLYEELMRWVDGFGSLEEATDAIDRRLESKASK